MADETEKRANAIHRAAEFRERAARYESLAAEARQRGDVAISIELERRAAEELTEASRSEDEIDKK